jgi:hypothetical protein
MPVLISRAAPNSLKCEVWRDTAGPDAFDQDFACVHKTRVNVHTLTEGMVICSLQLELDRFATAARDY